MTSKAKTAQPRPRRPWWWRWLRRLGLTLLVLFLLLAIFHRPLFFEGTRYFVIRAAKQQSLELDYKISGSIFTTLRIEDLKGTPLESGPIQRLEARSVNLQYSLVDLVRKGPHAFLKTLELHDAFVELTPAEKPPPEKDAQPQSFKFPALIPERLVLDNVNFTSHGAKGDTVLDSLRFTLYPDAEGDLSVAVLDMPGIRRWEGITARTSYSGRNLVLTNLVLGPEIELERLNLDASKLEEDQLRVSAQGRVFTSQSTLDAHISDLNEGNRLNVTLGSSGGLVLDEIWAYLNIEPPIHGRAEGVEATFEGEPNAPRTWTAKLEARLEGAAFKEQALGDLELSVSAGGGVGDVTFRGAFDEQNTYRATTRVQLPETLDGFADADAEGALALRLDNVDRLGALLPPEADGGLGLSANYRCADGRLTLSKGRINTASLANGKTRLRDAELHFSELSRDLSLPEGAPPFATLRARIERLTAAQLQFAGYETERVDAALEAEGAKVTLKRLEVAKTGNRVSASGDYTLPADLKSWRLQPGNARFSIDAPELSAFVAPGSGLDLAGTLKAEGNLAARDGEYTGEITLTARELSARGLEVQSADARVEIAQGLAQIQELRVVLDERNHIVASGNSQLAAPYTYQGSAEVELSDLAVLRPLLPTGEEGARPELGGALSVRWTGEGQVQDPPRHTGSAAIDLADGRYAERTGINAKLTANYTPETLSAPDVAASADGLPGVTVSVHWENDRLEARDLVVRDGETTLVAGWLSAPLHLAEFRDARRLVPGDQPLSAELQTRDLNFARILEQLGMKPDALPVTGVLTLDLKAEGTLNQPIARLDLQATELRATAEAARKLAPTQLDLKADLREHRLSAQGELRQALVQPIQLSGNLPLDVNELRRAGRLDPETPVEFSVSMPRTDLSVLEGLVPQIRQSRGAISIQAQAAGPLKQPRLSGEVTGNLEYLRFTDPGLPPIDAMALNVAFLENRVEVRRLAGRVAGGEFRGGGSVDLRDRENPMLNLAIGSRNALLVQDDALTVRASANLNVAGPLNSAKVTGAVYFTRSRFYKDVDILPIGLPGRPAPKPPPEPRVVSFPNPPLRDWTFDVAIRTADPFMVMGNLARGQATADLRLGGTGLSPWLDGSVHVTDFTASLPFSRLGIDDGLIYFEQTHPFVPMLNIRGHSTIRSHEVQVYMYGPATDPKAVFSSDPPLPQADVVSLIATGTTTEELSGDPNALAGRGALLLFQKIYRSVFRKGMPTDSLTENTVLENVQFEIGAADPTTGQSGASVRVPMAENVVLVGGVDVSGNFRGQVKYLVRFK